MTKDAQIILVIALAIIAYIGYTATKTKVQPSTIDNLSTSVPWFQNYNTTAPFLMENMPTLNAQATVQSTASVTSPLYQMFGANWGSQY